MRLVSSTRFVTDICVCMFEKKKAHECLEDWWISLSHALGLVKLNQHNYSSEDLLLCVTHFTLQIKMVLEQSFPSGIVVVEMLYGDYS